MTLGLTNPDVLVVGPGAIEIMDISDHLRALGWQDPLVVGTASEAIELLSGPGPAFSLVVLTVANNAPDAAVFIQACSAQECPVIVVDGAVDTGMLDRVVVLNRPFMSTDIDQALVQLGFSIA